jgi:DNA modification methylase
MGSEPNALPIGSGLNIRRQNMPDEKYSDFLATKRQKTEPSGFEIEYIDCDMLYDFQADIVKWALALGKAALFLDCGLGKSPIQLAWAHHVCKHTGGNVLILAPLAVSKQTQREGDKFGFPVTVCRSGEDVQPGINITNYEMMHKFDLNDFLGIVLDESSILKAFAGKYKKELIEKCDGIQYKLCCTATPAPNDYIELGNHAEFLDICTQAQMLAQFFVNDRSDAGQYRLKGHARSVFWEWLCSWGIFLRDPGDIGYENKDFQLPPIEYHEYVIKSNNNSEWLVWCNLNDESEALAAAIPNAVEVQGKHDFEYKENAMMGFSDGSVRVLVSKPSIAGFGMNWQNCDNMAFVGLSDSFEQFYQATRRCWRFGQENPVDVHIVIADRESSIRDNIAQKEKGFQTMYDETIKHTKTLVREELAGETPLEVYRTTSTSADDWKMIHGDCVEEMSQIESESIDFSVCSPPFEGLYVFSDDPRDMSNCQGAEQFGVNFDFLASEWLRVTKPGRLVALHCADIPAMYSRDGYMGLKDFPGDLIRIMQTAGFIYHGRITIWKCPVLEATRTKTRALLWGMMKKDSTMSRVGIPDTIILMRKPGDNQVPVSHTDEEYERERWAKIAEPVWGKGQIRQGHTLNRVKGNDDERHISPLQLDTIQNLIELYSNPGEMVLSPFAGIGSEGYQALLMGRQFVGIELKQEYFDQAVKNLRQAEMEHQQALLI